MRLGKLTNNDFKALQKLVPGWYALHTIFGCTMTEHFVPYTVDDLPNKQGLVNPNLATK